MLWLKCSTNREVLISITQTFVLCAISNLFRNESDTTPIDPTVFFFPSTIR